MNQILGCAVVASEFALAREQHREALMAPAIKDAVNELTNPGAAWCPMDKFNFSAAIEGLADDKWAEFLANAKGKNKVLALEFLLAEVLTFCTAGAQQQVDAEVEDDPTAFMPDPADYYPEE